MFKKGESVLMRRCVGARKEPNKIWVCETDEYENKYKEIVVRLKDCDLEEFPTDRLEKYRAIYKLNDYEWYITPWDITDTVNWYNGQFEDNITIDEVELISIEKENEGLWMETADTEDINKLGDSDELVSTVINTDGKRIIKPKVGNLMKGLDGQILKFTSFKDVVEKYYLENPLKEPELIASIDY